MTKPNRKPVYLIISQVYLPDPASVGQHVAGAAAELVRRGYHVVVYAAANGYDDPGMKYPRHEMLDGVDVRRLPFSSFGKSSIAVRLIAQWCFLLQVLVRASFLSSVRGIMVSTSPPFCGFAGAFLSRLKGVPVKYWLMDLNPDQMIVMKKIAPGSAPARIFDFFNRMILSRASDIVVLDRFMLDRIKVKVDPAKVDLAAKTSIMPPWPHEEQVVDLPHAQNHFRKSQGLDGKFVVMYSGNHSPANPIGTILDAAEFYRENTQLVFMFIGGGSGKKEVEERLARQEAERAAGGKPVNIRSLPYQPLSQIKYSLSAADVHVVSIGDDVVGIVHPCKVYGAMAVSRPILLLGPNPSHISDLIEQHNIGWHIAHGDVAKARAVIDQMLLTSASQLAEMGGRAGQVVATSLSKQTLRARFCDVLEKNVRRASA